MKITFRKRRRRSRRRKWWLKVQQHQPSPQSSAAAVAAAATITITKTTAASSSNCADNQQRRRIVTAATCGVVRLFLAAYLLIGSGAGHVRYAAVAAVESSGSVCPNFCDCKWKDGKESVVCINANLTSIPTKLDAAGVLVLHLAGNLLFKLSNDVFYSSGFSNLQKLYLVRCNIKYIEPRAFYMLKNLVDLDLSENAFSVVPSLAFLPVPDLRELKLNGNYILKIGGYAFANVRRLVRLEISHCRIGYVDENAFSGLENTLRVLKLNKNRLYNLKPYSFTSFNALQTLDLSDNPLNCTCELRPLRDWMYEKGLSTHGGSAANAGSGSLPICHNARQNTNVSWHQLSADDFACLPSVYAPSRIVTAYEGDNVTLACRIDGGSPMPKMTWTLRNRVLSNSTFGYPVTDKRSYLIHSVADNYSNLTILSLEMQDTGEYVCVAENKAGKVIADVALTIEKAPIGTIISEKMVLIGIVATTILIICLCSCILFVRVMYCKHDTRADIESKRRILSEKIEMKRNSANAAKRSSSVLPNQSSAAIIVDENLQFQKMFKDTTQLTAAADDRYGSGNANIVGSVTQIDGGVRAAAEKKPAIRPKDFNEGKSLPNSIASDIETARSPCSSIFESHIGEIALQHHVLHKKELPKGKLYTTAMSFMTDDTMANYETETSAVVANESKKKTYYDTMPRNVSAGSDNRSRKCLSSSRSRTSESQSPLLHSKYRDSSSESLRSDKDGIIKNDYSSSVPTTSVVPSHRHLPSSTTTTSTQLSKMVRRQLPPVPAGSSSDSYSRKETANDFWRYANHSATVGTLYDDDRRTTAVTPAYDRYTRSDSISKMNNRYCTKETPLLNNIYDDANSRKTYAADFRIAAGSSLKTRRHFGSFDSIKTNNAADDYHAVQLERFLDEYRRLYSELRKMKETCERMKRDESSAHLSKTRSVAYGSKLGGVDHGGGVAVGYNYYGSLKERRRKFDSNLKGGSVRRSFATARSRSFDRTSAAAAVPLPNKNTFERSVSFVPSSSSSSVAVAAAMRSMVSNALPSSTTATMPIVNDPPKSILKKKSDQLYSYYPYKKMYRDRNDGSVAVGTSSPNAYYTLKAAAPSRVSKFNEASLQRMFYD